MKMVDNILSSDDDEQKTKDAIEASLRNLQIAQAHRSSPSVENNSSVVMGKDATPREFGDHQDTMMNVEEPLKEPSISASEDEITIGQEVSKYRQSSSAQRQSSGTDPRTGESINSNNVPKVLHKLFTMAKEKQGQDQTSGSG